MTAYLVYNFRACRTREEPIVLTTLNIVNENVAYFSQCCQGIIGLVRPQPNLALAIFHLIPFVVRQYVFYNRLPNAAYDRQGALLISS